MPPIITILFPTYNRQDFLAETLNIFYSQIKNDGLQDAVRLIVGDNGSLDQTHEVLLEKQILFIKQGIDFSFYRNQTNIGLTPSILIGLEKVASKFIWVFGDDDLLNVVALKKIIGILKETDKSFFIVPTEAFVDTKDVYSKVNNESYSIQVKQQEITATNVEFFDLNYGFLNSVIFSRSIAEQGLQQLKKSRVSFDNNYYMKALNYYCHLHLLKEERGVFDCPTLVFQRITTGSYFTKSAELIEKTFFHDNYEVADFISTCTSDPTLLKVINDRYYNASDKVNLVIIKLKSKVPNKALYKISKRIKHRNFLLLFLILVPKPFVFLLYRIYKRIQGTREHPIFNNPLLY